MVGNIHFVITICIPDLFNGGRRHSHTQAATAYGRDDFAGGVTAEDQPASGNVLLHRPPQSMLSILGQLVHLR